MKKIICRLTLINILLKSIINVELTYRNYPFSGSNIFEENGRITYPDYEGLESFLIGDYLQEQREDQWKYEDLPQYVYDGKRRQPDRVEHLDHVEPLGSCDSIKN